MQITKQNQQQPLMMTPPPVVTTKDLMYLDDAMSWLLGAAKKCAHYETESTCDQVKQAISQIGQMHQKHYNVLLQHCQNNNTQQMAQIPKQ